MPGGCLRGRYTAQVCVGAHTQLGGGVACACVHTVVQALLSVGLCEATSIPHCSQSHTVVPLVNTSLLATPLRC